MTRISMKDPFVLQLYKIRNVKKYDEFLELLEEVLNEAAERIYSSLNKNSVVSTFKDLCESAEKNIKDVDELKKHIVLLKAIDKINQLKGKKSLVIDKKVSLVVVVKI